MAQEEDINSVILGNTANKTDIGTTADGIETAGKMLDNVETAVIHHCETQSDDVTGNINEIKLLAHDDAKSLQNQQMENLVKQRKLVSCTPWKATFLKKLVVLFLKKFLLV